MYFYINEKHVSEKQKALLQEKRIAQAIQSTRQLNLMLDVCAV